MVTRNSNGPGGISIPIFGVERPGDAAQAGRTQKIQSFIPGPPVKIGQTAVEVVEATDLTDDGILIERIIITAAACAGCGRLFKTNAEVEAMCTFCHYSVCVGCTTMYRCSVCDRQGCSFSRCGKRKGGLFHCYLCIHNGDAESDEEE